MSYELLKRTVENSTVYATVTSRLQQIIAGDANSATVLYGDDPIEALDAFAFLTDNAFGSEYSALDYAVGEDERGAWILKSVFYEAVVGVPNFNLPLTTAIYNDWLRITIFDEQYTDEFFKEDGSVGLNDLLLHFYGYVQIDPSSPVSSPFWVGDRTGRLTFQINFSRKILERLQLWYSKLVDGILSEFAIEEIIKQEKAGSSEEDEIIEENVPDEVIEGIYTFLTKIKSNRDEARDYFLDTGFGNRDSTEKSMSYFRVFSKINDSVKDLTDISATNFFNKMEEIGLFTLASYAYEIGEFAKKRLRTKYTLKASADNVVDTNIDLPWLIALGEVVQRLKRDPLTFAGINYYFPSLSTFLVDALAVVGDYSNNGKGGGEEDTLNNADDFALSIEKAFGVTSVLTATDLGFGVGFSQSARAIFEMAYKFTNTSQRIQNVLKTSPFRANIAPNTPDTFHLRLGAANFYIPPISIDVNSNFKTGSLTGAAIRQKNSPKFNSGYKETSIRMRLFFPNYEEIWGLSVDALSRIDLNDTFKIDFKNGGDSEIKIDKFLSSLRGLVAAFKYSPILPIKNHYLNSVHGITAVALSNMTISTIPNYPFALAVDIELLNFNHQPFLPMIKDFNHISINSI
jgi:hypothetical protein